MTNMPITLFPGCIVTLFFPTLHVSSALGDNFCLSELPSVELAICLQTPALSAAALPFASETFSWGFNLQNIRRGESCHCGASRRVLISTGLRYLRISSREGTRVLNMGLQTPGMESQKYVVFNWDLVTIISGDCCNPSNRLLVPLSTLFSPLETERKNEMMSPGEMENTSPKILTTLVAITAIQNILGLAFRPDV